LSDRQLVKSSTYINPTHRSSFFLAELGELPLVDGGVHINAPLVPFCLPDRKTDVIFCFDARPHDEIETRSKNVLEPFMDYAKSKGLRSPPIDQTSLGKDIVTVFASDSTVECPDLLYMPLSAHNDAKESSIDPAKESAWDFRNFTYSATHFDNLSEHTRKSMTLATPRIKAALKARIEQKRLKRTKR